MKDAIPGRTIVLAFLVFQIFISLGELYNFKCPSQANWKIRAEFKCNNITTYLCLYNIVERTYIEGCNGPDWDRKGSKRIISGSITRGYCSHDRYQPFRFETKGSMSDCIYAKTICSEEGQIVFKEDSAKADRTCRCDHTKNYSFINTPRNICYCIPTKEDCSCYNTLSRVNLSGHDCIQRYKDNNNMNKHNETAVEEKHTVKLYYYWFYTTFKLDLEFRITATVLFGLCLIIGGFFLAVLFDKLVCEKQHPLMTFSDRRLSGTVNSNDVKFLRMIHILFRVACPVVRMIFNNEIKPNQLRKTLDDNRLKMETLYRDNETIINEYQWGLLYDKGDQVNSIDFDIRLMVYLLRTLANIDIVDIYPHPCVKSVKAMLSRIKCIRNEVARRFETDLTDERFNDYWDDIIQATLTLESEFDSQIDQNITRLIDNLKRMQIHKGGHLHHRDYKITDLNTEENNFLVVFYVLAKIVYPVIKKEFYKKCPELKYNEISENPFRKGQTENCKDVLYSRTKDTLLTIENKPCCLPKDELKNIDLKKMIYMIKQKPNEEEKKEYTDHLDVVCDIQSEIVQSSNGILNDERFNYILTCIKKAVVHLGGKWNEEKILQLQKTKVF